MWGAYWEVTGLEDDICAKCPGVRRDWYRNIGYEKCELHNFEMDCRVRRRGREVKPLNFYSRVRCTLGFESHPRRS